MSKAQENKSSAKMTAKKKPTAKKAAADKPKIESKSSQQRASVLQELYKDHRNISKTLQAFDDQLELYKEGSAANFKLMHDVMSYLVQAPDQYHHPFEENMFDMLAAKDSKLQPVIDQTRREHLIIKQAGEAVLSCLQDQIKAPGIIKETHIVDHGEKYIAILRNHIKQEEDLLFRQGDKLLSEQEWQQLAESIEQTPDDPLFKDSDNTNFDRLRDYMRSGVEAIVEKYSETQAIPIDTFKQNIDTLSSGASDIGTVIVDNSKAALQHSAISYMELLKTRPKTLSPWLSTPLDCAINGFDQYVKTVNQISDIVHRSYREHEDSLQPKPDSVDNV